MAMMAWLKSPGGSTTTAVAVAAILALFWFAPWTRPFPFPLRASPPVKSGPPMTAMTPPPVAPSPPAVSAPTAPTTPAPSTPAVQARPSQMAKAEPAPAVAAPGTPAPAPDATAAPQSAPAPPQAATEAAPDFDVVRVEPSGSAIVAGRGEPGSDVALLDGGKVIAHVAINGSGQFALLPPDLGEGSHYLTLQTTRADKSSTSSKRGVAVSIAKNGASKPLVAMLSPDKPVEVLSDGAPVAAPAIPGTPAATSVASVEAAPVPVAIQAVEASQGGKFSASGVAKAGNQCRLYLNGAFLADVTAGQDGRWSVKVEKGMRAGKYTVRADELEPKTGKVLHRAEVPFDYPVALAQGRAKQLLLSRAPPDKAGPSVAGAPAGEVAVTAPADLAPKASPAQAPARPGQLASNVPLSATTSDAATGPAATDSSALPANPVPSASKAGRAKPGQGPIGSVEAGKATVVTSPQSQTRVTVATATDPATAIVPDLQTAKVTRGDSLWRISRKMLGHGIDYTEIYASNTNQIRDPSLIYPGQILVVPARPN